MIELEIDTHIQDVADFFVEDLRRQAETRNIRPHQTAGRVERLENRHLVAERAKVVGDRQRGTAGADQGNVLAVVLRRRFRQTIR